MHTPNGDTSAYVGERDQWSVRETRVDVWALASNSDRMQKMFKKFEKFGRQSTSPLLHRVMCSVNGRDLHTTGFTHLSPADCEKIGVRGMKWLGEPLSPKTPRCAEKTGIWWPHYANRSAVAECKNKTLCPMGGCLAGELW